MRNLFDSEGRRVGWLITELERQTTDRLSEESRLDLLDEVACHLDAAIQARLELGMSPIEAEKEAVEAFGHPKSYVDDLLRIHEANGQRQQKVSRYNGEAKTLIAFWILTAFCGFCLLSGEKTWSLQSLLTAIALLGPLFAYFSFRARRVQAAPILISSVIAGFLMSICFVLTWDDLWQHGGMGFAPKWQTTATLAADKQTLAALEPLILPLQHRAALHAKYRDLVGFGTDDLTQSGGSEWPIQVTVGALHELQEVPVADWIPKNLTDPSRLYRWSPEPGSSITFASAQNLKEAERLWNADGAPMLEGLIARKNAVESEMAAINGAQNARWADDLLPIANQAAGVSAVWFVFWCAINMFFGGLGWFLSLPIANRRREPT